MKKLFKNKKELGNFKRKHGLLDSTNNQFGTKEEFIGFMEEVYDIILKRDNSFLYSDKKLAGKIAGKRLLMKMDKLQVE